MLLNENSATTELAATGLDKSEQIIVVLFRIVQERKSTEVSSRMCLSGAIEESTSYQTYLELKAAIKDPFQVIEVIDIVHLSGVIAASKRRKRKSCYW